MSEFKFQCNFMRTFSLKLVQARSSDSVLKIEDEISRDYGKASCSEVFTAAILGGTAVKTQISSVNIRQNLQFPD